MYEHFFKLRAEPFRLSPDHRFCYNHVQYAKAKAYMAYAFMRAEGFVMVTGQPGTGKTTLIGDLVESLADENVVVANLVSTQLAADDLLRMVAYSFGLTANAAEKSAVLQQLSSLFLGLHREGGRALLIVDEAQDLTHTAMEELRLLTNLQQDGQPLLQIFLLGQPELRELIHSPELEQVHQRIIATSNLRALELDETRAYVEHRLRVVGWQNDPTISAAVYPIIYQFSEGVPRRINLICSRLLLHTFVEQRHKIGVADARTVVQELQEEQLSTRNLLNDDLFYADDVYETAPHAVEPTAARDREERDEDGEEGGDEEPGPDSGGTISAAPPAQPESRAAAKSPARRKDSSGATRCMAPDAPRPEIGPALGVSAEVAHVGKSPVSLDAWVMLFSGLIAAGLVVFFVGLDRIL